MKETRLIANPEPTETGWVGNTLTSYDIGVMMGQHWTHFKLVEGWTRFLKPLQNIAWVEIAAIQVGMTMLQRLGVQPGKTFLVWRTIQPPKVQSRTEDLRSNTYQSSYKLTLFQKE
ncbi:hypothetical protein PSTG_09680 [Puccinia striiformis f. sp. tritici PST-78]|uniref:Uncharacterized protein n=1 Tax=Puccinia striiformis f. sp. tritici PST-78 TaxID=1165861 RepID=A0A0L0VD53_9BASI|nr:hypothetical protein PSTG_09680 [Puccinia striiformis f. sp. tritici PST-78]